VLPTSAGYKNEPSVESSGSLCLQGKRVRIGAAGGPIGDGEGSNCPGRRNRREGRWVT
jgi:hypothetical protein